MSILSRRRPVHLYIIACISCIIIWILYGRVKDKVIKEPFTAYSDKDDAWYQDWYHRFKQGRKIILLYTTWFDHREWADYHGRRLYERMENCDKAKNCLLTYDKSRIKQAAGVVFHGRDVEENRHRYYSADRLREVRNGVPQSQKWIFLSHENPWKDVNVYKPYDGIFNWTATFSRKSNVFVPYDVYEPRIEPVKQLRNYAKEKTGLVAWAVSNCRSRLRLDYVLQLQKYIDVTVYGKCNCYFGKRKYCKHLDKGCSKEFSKYKFYLAFENDFCHDYVTEKYWQRIQENVVPVVMGSNYDEGVAIPGSFINTRDFKTIEQLANYLLYLDKNDDEYNKYFAYKAKYKTGGSGLYCKMCEKLNSDEANRSTQVTLSEEFNYDNNCGVKKKKSKMFQQQVDESAKDDNFLATLITNIWCWFHRLFH